MRRAILVALLVAAVAAGAQEAPRAPLPQPPRALEVASPGGAILSFRLHGRTTVELAGTERTPQAAGEAKVESKLGYVEIEIDRGNIKGLEPASGFGQDYLTYVLWAVSQEGAAMNLGEIVVRENRAEGLKVSAPLQTFWLMVTAEPDFAVHDPSPAVVLVSQNQEETRTSNKAVRLPGALMYFSHYNDYQREPAEADYQREPAAAATPKLEAEAGQRPEFLQARKAVELAERSGVLGLPAEEKRAQELLAYGKTFLTDAESRAGQAERDEDLILQYARIATELAESARGLAVGATGGGALQRLTAELEAAKAREAETRAELAQAQRQVTSLNDRLTQLEASLDAERRRTRELEGQVLALRERASLLENQVTNVQQGSSRLQTERGQLCEELRRQLASLGQLSQRGNEMALALASDILFDFNSYDLRPAARENLAKLSILGLLLFPEAAVRYEGHTDLVGEEDYNQWLSEQRALSVYRYFLEDRLDHSQIPDERTDLEARVNTAEQLLKMNFNAARRQAAPRQELLAKLGGVVVGKGMREPLVDERGANDQNRRVTLIFPQTTAGGLTSLCPAVAPAT